MNVTQWQGKWQEMLGMLANEAGRKSGFIRRQRKLNGAAFVSGVVWGWLANPQASLSELSQSIGVSGVPISPQGLAQRLDERGAACLQAVLEECVKVVAQENAPTDSGFLKQFNGVYLLDSSDVALPAALREMWPGGGNQTQSRAGLKLQTLWDYAGGGLWMGLHPARCADVRLPVPRLPAGAIRIQDSGYFDAQQLSALSAQGCFYLMRVPAKVKVLDKHGRAVHLSTFLRKTATPTFDGWVSLTAHRLPCRLIAQRVPDAVVAKRRQRLLETAKRKNKPVSAEAMALAAWTILITNVPPQRLSVDQALFLLRLRWQIELLFKLFKQHACLESSRSTDPFHILCEIFAKLIGLLLQHAVLIATAWHIPNRSLVNLARVFRHCVRLFAFALWAEPSFFAVVFDFLALAFRAASTLHKRKRHPSHFQLLLSLS